MPYKNREDRLAYQRRYSLSHPLTPRAKDVKRCWAEIQNARRKEEVFLFYSKGAMQCASCGISDSDVLCIDHIYNNGREHRRLIGNKGGNAFYRWLQKNNYPEGYQVLCANCNQKKQVLRNKREGNR